MGWSPDGTTLAYDGPSASGRGSLELLTLANGETRSIALPRGGFAAPQWSPDGRNIALLEQDGNRRYVAALDPATGASSLRRVTRNMYGIKRVDWSPDGTQIAFTAGSFDFSVGTTSDLYVVNADGTGQRRVTHVTRGQRVAGVDWAEAGRAVPRRLQRRRCRRVERGRRPDRRRWQHPPTRRQRWSHLREPTAAEIF